MTQGRFPEGINPTIIHQTTNGCNYFPTGHFLQSLSHLFIQAVTVWKRFCSHYVIIVIVIVIIVIVIIIIIIIIVLIIIIIIIIIIIVAVIIIIIFSVIIIIIIVITFSCMCAWFLIFR